MGIFSDIFGKKDVTNSNSTSTRDPWAPAVPYLTGALGIGQNLYDQYSQLSPEEEQARQNQIQALQGRQGGPIYDQATDQASSILGGAYNPQLTKTYGVAPSLVNYDFGSSDPAQARKGQGKLDPTTALQRILGGQVDNPQLQRMADASTRGQQRAYQDAVSDSDQSLTQSVLPSIGRGAMQAGGYGGTRQGIAEGLAIGQRNKDLDRNARDLGIAAGDNTANLYGNAYESAQNRMAGAARDLDQEANQARQFDVGNAFTARKANADADQRSQEFNVNNYNTQNQQELSKAGLIPTILGQGLNLAQGANNMQTGDYSDLMGALGLPRSLAWDSYSNMVNPLTNIAGLGGTTNTTGSVRNSKRDSLFNIGAQLAAMAGGGGGGGGG